MTYRGSDHTGNEDLEGGEVPDRWEVIEEDGVALMKLHQPLVGPCEVGEVVLLDQTPVIGVPEVVRVVGVLYKEHE